MLHILGRVKPLFDHTRVPVTRRRRFVPRLDNVAELESRLLLSGGPLDLSKDVWNVTNGFLASIITPTRYSTAYDPSQHKTVTTSLVKVQLMNSEPFDFGGRVGNVDVILSGSLPTGVMPKSIGGFTSDGDSYFVFGNIKSGATRSLTFTYYGKLPSAFSPALRVVVAPETPIIPAPSPTPPAGNAMGPIDLAKFDSVYEMESGTTLNKDQTTQLNQLAKFISNDANIKDLRWAAYMLATADIETGHTFNPATDEVRGGRNKDNLYWQQVTAPNGTQQTYYGRGYSQLTFAYNYALFGAYLNDQGVLPSSESLLNDPEHETEIPAIAYDIFSYGMRTGAFTSSGNGLDYYINGSQKDYLGARNIENPGDSNAKNVADVAENFEAALRASITQQTDKYSFNVQLQSVDYFGQPADHIVINAVPSIVSPPTGNPPVFVVDGPIDLINGVDHNYSSTIIMPKINNGVALPESQILMYYTGFGRLPILIYLKGKYSYNFTISLSNPNKPPTIYATLSGTFTI